MRVRALQLWLARGVPTVDRSEAQALTLRNLFSGSMILEFSHKKFGAFHHVEMFALITPSVGTVPRDAWVDCDNK